MRPTTRREFLKPFALGSGGALLAACSQPAQPAPPPAPSAATTAPVPTQAPPKAAATQPAPTAVPAAQVKDVSFVVVDGTEPNSLDPCVGTATFQHIINAMYDNLVTWNVKMEVEAALATSWQVSDDGKVWTFKLRQGVKFHDGTAFTSQAVRATFDHLMDKDTMATRRGNYTLIKEIATPDDFTVKFTTDPPNPDLPFLLADNSAKILSPAALQKYGKDFGRNPVGTGPFKFEEWKPNDHVSAVINPDYWGTKPLVRRFVYKPIPEAAARTAALRTGEADAVFNLAPSDVDALKKDSNLIVQVTPGLTIVEGEPRQSKPPLNDVRVRTALNMAIDRQAICDKIMQGFATPLKTPSVPGIWGTFEFDPMPYDPAKAKQLLAEAGRASGMELNIRYVSGRWAGDDQVAEAMQGYWNAIGVKTNVIKIQMADLIPQISADPDTFPGTLFLLTKTNEFQDYHLYQLYHSEATHANNAQHYAYGNPEVDKLLDLERRTFEPEKRLPIFKQAEELIWKDQPLVFLFHRMNIWGQRKNASGFGVLPSNRLIPGALTK